MITQTATVLGAIYAPARHARLKIDPAVDRDARDSNTVPASGLLRTTFLSTPIPSSTRISEGNDDSDIFSCQQTMDSDSDDSLLGETHLRRRPKRATKQEQEEQRKKARQNSLLESAVKSADRSYHSRMELNRMQSQNSETMGDDELALRCTQAQESVRKNPVSIADIASGVAEYADDGVHDPVTKRRLVQAFETEGSVSYGLRPTIHFDPTRDEEGLLQFYTDEKQAMEELKSILKDSKVFQTECNSLCKELDQSADPQWFLVNLLAVGGKISQLMTEDKGDLSSSLAKWLFGMACSANASDFVSDTATTLLSHLLKKKKLSGRATGSFDETGHLVAWCDTNKWPLQSTLKGDKAGFPDEYMDRNLGGLMNLITLWTVSLQASSSEERIAIDDASLALKALFFIGIDPKVVSPKFSIGLQSAIRKLIRAIFRKLEQSLESGASPFECARCLSMEILVPLTSEIKALQGTRDYAYDKAHLTFPALVRGGSVPSPQISTPKLLSATLCEMIAHALAIMGTTEPLDNKSIAECVTESAREAFASLPEPTQRAFATAMAAVDAMLEWGTDVASHAPQALAMTECATQAIRSGLMLLQVPYTDDQKVAIAAVLDRMDEQVNTFMGRLKAAGLNEFLRHLDSNWRLHRLYVKDLYDRITAKQSTGMSDTPIQKKLTSFFAAEDSPCSAPTIRTVF